MKALCIKRAESLATERESFNAERHSLTAATESLAAERESLTTEPRSCLRTSGRRLSTARGATEQAQAHQAVDNVAREAASLAAARDELQRQQQTWAAERDQLHARLAEGLQQCQQRSACLDSLRTEFEQQQSAQQVQQLEAQKQLEVRRTVLDQQAEELEAARRELDRRREQIEAVELAAAEKESREREAPAAVSGMGNMPDVAVMVDEPVEADPQSGEDTSTDDIFARLRSLALLKDDADESPSGVSLEASGSTIAERTIEPPEDAPDHVTAPSSASTAHSAESEEESIDEYMARLLNRVRGISSEQPAASKPAAIKPAVGKPAAVKPAAAPVPATEVQLANEPDQAESAAGTPPLLDEPVINGPLVARSTPPEMAVNMAAMRELANTTARRAISHHAQGRWGKLAMGKTVSAIVVLGFGVWLIWQSLSGSLAFRYSGVAAVIVAGYWLAQAAVLARNVRQVRHRAQKPAGAKKLKADPKAVVAKGGTPNADGSHHRETASK